ncbi:ABC transporter ATP-binding protein [Leucobacter chinensis]|uniref:ABC transporter ATP-binding protein n=1 Tax=Leucobacter chinensis TaxID=2851010 RepID=UPI0020B71B32|nr:ATP-binding cassette domain-containing protein [Leucobacter chinensis]
MLIGEQTPLSQARDITVTFPGPSRGVMGRREKLTALNRVTMHVNRGDSLAIVGESGSGKSTLVRALLGLQRVDSGEVTYDGRRVTGRGRERWLRSRTGIVFQDPYSSFSPRLTIGESVAEPLEALEIDCDRSGRVTEVLSLLGLPADAASRYPSAFSGGQRQRIAIARGLIHRPDLLIGDEPVSALDVLVRQSILRQLATLRRELGLTMINVTHDLSIVPDIADHVLVLQAGKVVETGTVEAIFGNPQDPYTQSLIRAIPRLEER